MDAARHLNKYRCRIDSGRHIEDAEGEGLLVLVSICE